MSYRRCRNRTFFIISVAMYATVGSSNDTYRNLQDQGSKSDECIVVIIHFLYCVPSCANMLVIEISDLIFE